MSVATLASRITGLARTWVMAFALGNTLITSAYQVANNTPNMIFELAAGGLLNAAFVPLYLLQMERFGRKGGNRYASNLLNIVILIMGVLSILASIFAPQVIATQTFASALGIGEPLEPAAVETAIGFFRIFAWQLLFYGIGGVVTAVLNAHRVYFLPSIAPACNNLVVIASFILYMVLLPADAQLALIVLGVGTTLGVVAQLAVQIPALIKQNFKWELRIDFKDPGFVDTIKAGIPMTIYIVGTLFAFSFRNAFGYASSDIGPSTLFYAWTWFQLPHGIIAVSLSRALFTEMSTASAADDMPAFKRYMQTGIRGTLLAIIPLAGLMFVLSEPLMLIFQAGAFNAEDVTFVGNVLSAWVVALPFYSLQFYLFNVFASLKRFTQFSVICTALCVLQCALYAVLTGPGGLGLIGICVSDFVYYSITTIILLVVLRRYVGGIGTGGILAVAVKSLAATLVGAGLVKGALIFLPIWSGPLGGFFTVMLYGGIALVLILTLCRLLRVQEISMLTGAAKRLLKRG